MNEKVVRTKPENNMGLSEETERAYKVFCDLYKKDLYNKSLKLWDKLDIVRAQCVICKAYKLFKKACTILGNELSKSENGD